MGKTPGRCVVTAVSLAHSGSSGGHWSGRCHWGRGNPLGGKFRCAAHRPTRVFEGLWSSRPCGEVSKGLRAPDPLARTPGPRPRQTRPGRPGVFRNELPVVGMSSARFQHIQ